MRTPTAPAEPEASALLPALLCPQTALGVGMHWIKNSKLVPTRTADLPWACVPPICLRFLNEKGIKPVPPASWCEEHFEIYTNTFHTLLFVSEIPRHAALLGSFVPVAMIGKTVERQPRSQSLGLRL